VSNRKVIHWMELITQNWISLSPKRMIRANMKSREQM